MKIYTKGGDKGTTSLVGGKRVAKDHERLEAYGSIDELISTLGLLGAYPIGEDYRKHVLEIQNALMKVAALLACEDMPICQSLPQIIEKDIQYLEETIDNMERNLLPLQQFIIPGGHIAVATAHVTRTICRRAERCIVKLSHENFVPDSVVSYVNRLSDFLFVMGRAIAKETGTKEIFWTK